MTEFLGCPALRGATRRRHRAAAATRERLLKAALAEYYSGARTAATARGARRNIRMILPEFGNKEGLYLASSERV